MNVFAMTPQAPKVSFDVRRLRRRRVSEAVADNVRDAIFNGQLLPGHKLATERELADRHRTSRVAVREALRALENEGMIQIKRGFRGGAFISDFDNALRALLESLNTVVRLGQPNSFHLTEVLRILEPQMAEIATLRATGADLRAIEAIVIAQEEELNRGKLSRRYDMEFQRNLVKATHNPFLHIIVNAITDSLEVFLRSRLSGEMQKRVASNHRRIFEALRNHTPKEAHRLMREHVTAVRT